jgi:hypothetical protein
MKGWLKKSCALFVFLLAVMSADAQITDTIKYSLKQKPSFFFNLTAFNSIVSNENANFFGFKAGISYNKRIKFGAGLYTLTSNVVSPISIPTDSVPYSTNGELRLNFLSLSAEYNFFVDYPWQFSITPVQFSFGEGHYRYISEPDKQSLKTKKQTVLLYEPNIMGQFSVFRWLAIAAGFGYRIKVVSSKQLNEDLTAPTYAIGFRVFLDELYRMAFPGGAFHNSGQKK